MYRPTEAADIDVLAATMREADRQEVRLLTGMAPKEALTQGYVLSVDRVTGIGKGGEIVCMAGIVPSDVKGFASVWMLSSDAIKRNSREFLQEGRRWLKRMTVKHGTLSNVVTAENKLHLHLLSHMGFKLGTPIQHAGVHRVPVIPFRKR